MALPEPDARDASIVELQASVDEIERENEAIGKELTDMRTIISENIGSHNRQALMKLSAALLLMVTALEEMQKQRLELKDKVAEMKRGPQSHQNQLMLEAASLMAKMRQTQEKTRNVTMISVQDLLVGIK